MSMDDILLEAEDKMDKAVEFLRSEYLTKHWKERVKRNEKEDQSMNL